MGSGERGRVLQEELERGDSSLRRHQKLKGVHDLKKRIRTSELKEREFDMCGAGVSNTWRNDHRWANTLGMFSHH